METIINITIYFILTVFIAYLGFRILSYRATVRELLNSRIQSQIDFNIAVSEYQKVLQELENKKLEKSDDFVKFLSDSRDWAFNYIEEVQEALSKFDKRIAKIVKWNDTYGTSTGDNPHSDKIKEISVAYKQLKDLLPENKQTPNN
jgi:hypothetical protein